MMYDYVLDDADVGRVLDPPDGFVVKLIRTKPPVNDGPPRASADGTWLSGRLQLRGGLPRPVLRQLDVLLEPSRRQRGAGRRYGHSSRLALRNAAAMPSVAARKTAHTSAGIAHPS